MKNQFVNFGVVEIKSIRAKTNEKFLFTASICNSSKVPRICWCVHSIMFSVCKLEEPVLTYL